MAGSDVTEFARDEKREFPAPQMFVILTRDDERIRFADADGRDRNEGIVADEDLRCGHTHPGGEMLDQLRDFWELSSFDADARADQAPARER